METTTSTTTFTHPSSAPSAAVRFADVTRRFGDVTAIDGIDLDIRPGETVALLGPNGAGKSTAISMMLGLLRPTAGTVTTLALDPADARGERSRWLDPPNVRSPDQRPRRRARRRSPAASTAPAAEGGGRRTGRPDRPARPRDRHPLGGEAQRLRFAFAIAGDPDLVFLDEPTVAMDVEMRRAFWADMRRSADEGRTILFATHYLEEADQVADRSSCSIMVGSSRRKQPRDPRQRPGQDGPLRPQQARRGRAPLPHRRDRHLGRRPSRRLTTSDADATVRALYAAALPIRNLEVTGADLEDAFVALTTPTATTDAEKETLR
jgi:ABC-2 type transport system ATP-binding protein